MFRWLSRRRAAPAQEEAGTSGAATPPADALWTVEPPAGVRLVSSRPSRTGEGGQGVLALYSDGTTASAMVNTDGSVRVLFFRAAEAVPAVPMEGAPGRFTWRPEGGTPATSSR